MSKDTDYVDLSMGRVYFRPLTNGILNKVTTMATMAKDILNNNYFFNMMEFKLLKLSKRKQNKLTVSDGNKVREKLREILTRHGVLTNKPVEVQPQEADLWKDHEKEYFDNSRAQALERVKRGMIKGGK